MGVSVAEVVGYLDRELGISGFRDYARNGLQVEASSELRRVITGVSAHSALTQAAIERDAQLMIVHHGLFWGPGLPALVGRSGARIGEMIRGGVSLAAYHLPLDAHPTWGNNAGLSAALGVAKAAPRFGDIKGCMLGWQGEFVGSRSEFLSRVVEVCGPSPFVFPHGPDRITQVGLCTGAASDMLEEAAEAGCEVFVTGELAERAGELARELGITLVAAGHHASEVFGPRSLAHAVAAAFPDLEVDFVDIPSPL